METTLQKATICWKSNFSRSKTFSVENYRLWGHVWGCDYYETTAGSNRDKSVQRSISPVGPEAHTGESDVIASLELMTSSIINQQKSFHPLFF